jgi:hypothetical protein
VIELRQCFPGSELVTDVSRRSRFASTTCCLRGEGAAPLGGPRPSGTGDLGRRPPSRGVVLLLRRPRAADGSAVLAGPARLHAQGRHHSAVSTGRATPVRVGRLGIRVLTRAPWGPTPVVPGRSSRKAPIERHAGPSVEFGSSGRYGGSQPQTSRTRIARPCARAPLPRPSLLGRPATPRAYRQCTIGAAAWVSASACSSSPTT